MNRNKPVSNTAGFTIVEMLIVLAVAGIMFLLVFEAIPALVRSGHNNQRHQDITIILGAVSRYELNDSGNFPLICGGGTPCDISAGSAAPNDYFLRFVGSKLTFYQASSIYLHPQTAQSAMDQAGVGNISQVDVYNYEKCDPSNPGNAVIQSAGYNDVVALFALETGSGRTIQCQQL